VAVGVEIAVAAKVLRGEEQAVAELVAVEEQGLPTAASRCTAWLSQTLSPI